MLGNMEKKRDYDRATRPNRTERKRANLKFAKMREGPEKQMADKAVASITSLDLA
jgi:hypothetical protein